MITVDEIVKRDLVKEIRFFDYRDDEDWPSYMYSLSVDDVVSDCNRRNMLKYFKSLENCKSILEIGVNDYIGCLSRVLIDNKKDETKYIGVDINVVPFKDETKNQFGIETDSANYEEIMSFANSKGVNTFDFIFIDGWHSINQVLKEWRFVEFLSPNGMIAMHDTNHHPGPKFFVDNLNPEKYIIEKQCTEDNDYGVTFITKR